MRRLGGFICTFRLFLFPRNSRSGCKQGMMNDIPLSVFHVSYNVEEAEGCLSLNVSLRRKLRLRSGKNLVCKPDRWLVHGSLIASNLFVLIVGRQLLEACTLTRPAVPFPFIAPTFTMPDHFYTMYADEKDAASVVFGYNYERIFCGGVQRWPNNENLMCDR